MRSWMSEFTFSAMNSRTSFRTASASAPKSKSMSFPSLHGRRQPRRAPQQVGYSLELLAVVTHLQRPRLDASEVQLNVVLEHEPVSAVEVEHLVHRLLGGFVCSHEGHLGQGAPPVGTG